jgi:hypothetical protein
MVLEMTQDTLLAAVVALALLVEMQRRILTLTIYTTLQGLVAQVYQFQW